MWVRMKKYLMMVGLLMLSGIARADLKCGGTEPFWSLAIGSSKAIYENVGEDQKIEFGAITQQDAQGLKPGYTRKYTFKNAKTTADAVVLKKKCDDGMSDKTYPYTITLTVGKTVLAGCCW